MYLRLIRSHSEKKWGESVSGRRNGICEGPKAGRELTAFQKVQEDECEQSQEWGRWKEREQKTQAGLHGPR